MKKHDVTHICSVSLHSHGGRSYLVHTTDSNTALRQKDRCH